MRRKCPACRELMLPTTHIPTPELSGLGDGGVWWCVTAQKHAVVRREWLAEIRLSAHSLRRALRLLLGRA